jgi:tellurite resistance-related uncharacterized protein
MDASLPSHAILRDISATYNEHTIPRALLAPHTLPPETWARVVVAEGEVELKQAGRTTLTIPGREALVPPHTPFYLAPTGKPVRFCLHYFHEPVLQDGQALAGALGRKRVA